MASPTRPNQAQVFVAPTIASPAFDVVVIGGSAGGLAALSVVLGELPGDFPAPVAIVLHLSPAYPSLLTGVLARFSALPVQWATDGVRLERGTVYVAPPDWHLVFLPTGVIELKQTPPVHFSRPSVDLLFSSAARAFERRTLAVILSGNGRDGSTGVADIHRLGGVVIAQDEASSEFFSMPRGAIGSGGVTFVLPLASIGLAVTRLVTLGAAAGVETPPFPD